jgi:hypothetical protein
MKLAELYLRAERPIGAEFEGVAAELERKAVELAREIFVQDVTVEFELRDGSIVERVKVVGQRLVIVGGLVSTYHGLRESVIDIYHDARWFGEVAAEQFQQVTHTPKTAIQYKRMIPTDVERLNRIIENADMMQDAQLSPAARAQRINSIAADITGLSVSSRREIETGALIKALPWDKVPEGPDTVIEAVKLEEQRKKQ